MEAVPLLGPVVMVTDVGTPSKLSLVRTLPAYAPLSSAMLTESAVASATAENCCVMLTVFELNAVVPPRLVAFTLAPVITDALESMSATVRLGVVPLKSGLGLKRSRSEAVSVKAVVAEVTLLMRFQLPV